MAEIVRWITVNGAHVPIMSDGSVGGAAGAAIQAEERISTLAKKHGISKEQAADIYAGVHKDVLEERISTKLAEKYGISKEQAAYITAGVLKDTAPAPAGSPSRTTTQAAARPKTTTESGSRATPPRVGTSNRAVPGTALTGHDIIMAGVLEDVAEYRNRKR